MKNFVSFTRNKYGNDVFKEKDKNKQKFIPTSTFSTYLVFNNVTAQNKNVHLKCINKT